MVTRRVALVRSFVLAAFVLGLLLVPATRGAAQTPRGAVAPGPGFSGTLAVSPGATTRSLFPKPGATGAFTVSSEVVPDGTSARISISTSVSAKGTLYYSPEGGPVVERADRSFFVRRSMPLNNLAPGTTYYYQFVGVDAQGNQATSEIATFTTLKKRYRVAIDRIGILRDGDTGGAGEPIWDFGVEVMQANIVRFSPAGCYPYNKPKAQQTRGVDIKCVEGSTREANGVGLIYPRNSEGEALGFIFPAEGLPPGVTIRLFADGYEQDSVFGGGDFRCPGGGPCSMGEKQYEWHLDSAEEGKRSVTLRADHVESGAQDLRSYIVVTLEVFYDNNSYSDNGGFHSTWR